MQLPFSATTGEGILYNTGPTIDVQQFQFNQRFGADPPQSINPGSLVDCFLKQDSSAYSPASTVPPSVDEIFTDSRALLSVPSSTWDENGAKPHEPTGMVVKEEAKQSMVSVIDTLGKLSQEGDLCSALQDLDVPSAELMEWEGAIHRLGQDQEQHGGTVTTSELDRMFMNNIFDFIEEALFKDDSPQRGTGGGSCLVAAANMNADAVVNGGSPTGEAFALCEPQLFQTASPDCAFTPPRATNGSDPTAATHPPTPHAFGCRPPQPPDAAIPPMQRLQLQDIFSQAIELPPLAIPSPAESPALQDFHPCIQAGHAPTRGVLAPLGCSVQPQTNGVADVVPSLVPCQDVASSSLMAPVAAVPSQVGYYHSSAPLHHKGNPWQQGAPPPSPASHPAVMTQNGHRWPVNGQGLHHHNQVQQGVSAQDSCMYSRHFPHGPAGGEAMSLSAPSNLQGGDASSGQSPPQSSCYFPWKQLGEPAAVPAGGIQGSASTGPAHIAAPPSNGLLHGHAFGTQRYMEPAILTQGGAFHRSLESYGHQQGNSQRK